jgi:hypothetical protein
MRRTIKRGIAALLGVIVVLAIASIVSGFSTWPWQITHLYSDGQLGLGVGASKLDVWNRILTLQDEGRLVRGAGRNNDSRASTTEFSQVSNLDWWSFPVPPCCRCSLDLTFDQGYLKHFEKHCNYAPEGP